MPKIGVRAISYDLKREKKKNTHFDDAKTIERKVYNNYIIVI